MTVTPSIDPARLLEEQLAQASPDLLRELLTILINTLMSAESDAVCGAAYGLAVRGAADRIRLRTHQRADERGQHLPQQIRRGRGQLLVQESGRVNTGIRGHRDVSFRSTVEGLPKDHAMTASHASTPRPSRARRTPLCWTPLATTPERRVRTLPIACWPARRTPA
jgi:hypothetical protein